MEWIKVEGKGKMFCESLAHGHSSGFINGNHSVLLIKGPSLIWEVRNFLLDDFSNSDLELNKLELLRCHLLHLPAPIAFRLLLKPMVPRILEVRGVIASNYVSEFHSKLKAFMSDSK